MRRAIAVGMLFFGGAYLFSSCSRGPSPATPPPTTTVSQPPPSPRTSTTPAVPTAPAPRQVPLPASLRPNGPEFAREFAPGDPAPSTWFWTLGTFHGPYLIVPKDQDIEVTLQLQPGSFPSQVNPTLTVTQGSTQVFKQQLNGMKLNREHVIGPIRIPSLIHKGALELTWKVTTWKPSVVGTNPKDSRDLGLDIKAFGVKLAPK